ncbi:toxin [Streptomyces abyssalis]|uniref:Toxin n=1 Tax=Streptomyces abyssalis TaxID=933944 RepID=A0A1E7JJM3_9ACTN|nr:DUF397 domain-containing protein [Streptomyces abyssalis]OEU87290.1 toxin [Streptomyces abyssalis]OEU87822.1 toxin [Streptomyces abyssalis]OEV29143.1 toxin [Streptomyces nanshensis]
MTLKPSVPDGSTLTWIKSSYSGSNDNDCVEAAATPGTVHIRDSKNTRGPRLAFTAAAWTEFVSYARAGR